MLLGKVVSASGLLSWVELSEPGGAELCGAVRAERSEQGLQQMLAHLALTAQVSTTRHLSDLGILVLQVDFWNVLKKHKNW